jgi:hypothetical protein
LTTRLIPWAAATLVAIMAAPVEATCDATALDVARSSHELAATICARLDSPDIEEIRITDQTIAISLTPDYARKLRLIIAAANGRRGTLAQQLAARRLLADTATVYRDVRGLSRGLGGIVRSLFGDVRLMTDRTTWLMTINADGTYTTIR